MNISDFAENVVVPRTDPIAVYGKGEFVVVATEGQRNGEEAVYIHKYHAEVVANAILAVAGELDVTNE